MTGLNPVEQRLSVLAEHWMDFRAHPAARALVWQVPAEALRLVDCFVEMQKHPVPYATGDVFMPLKAPYRHGLQYARDLKLALRGICDASARDIAAEGKAPEWAFDPSGTPDTPLALAEALHSFASACLPDPHRLAVVLRPATTASAEAWVAWLRRLLAAAADGPRFLLVDTVEEPQWQAAFARGGELPVLVQAPPVRVSAMAQETFAQEPAVGPAGVYRNLMMGVVTLLGTGTLEAVLAKAADALAFARKQGWADQEVALRTMVAGAYLRDGRPADAVQTYQAARASALQALGAEHPAGLKLLQQAWVGEAGAHLAASDFARASDCYAQAAETAGRDGNALLQIESHRMDGWCLWRAGRPQEGLDRIARAAEIGAAMAPELRAQSTLPIALVDALRIVDAARVTTMQQAKGALRDRLDVIRADSEERGQALERRPDALDIVEKMRDDQSEQAVDETRGHFEALIGRAAAAFADIAGRGRQMLGDEWLVADDVALRPLPPERGATRSTAP